jgi:hypothetical protein
MDYQMTFTRIEYMYRDFSNWKWFGEFFVEGKLSLSDLSPYLWEGEQFNPLKLGLPHLLDEPLNQDDHFMHEILTVEKTNIGQPFCGAEDLLKKCSRIGDMGWFQ